MHPTVLLSLSDHSLRVRSFASSGGYSDVCAGILFGTQFGKRVEIFASSEMHIETSGGSGAGAGGQGGATTIDEAFVRQQKELMAEVFPDFEMLGWYIVTGSNTLGDKERALHRQVSASLIEGPLLLHLNDAAVLAPNQRTVPLNVYQAAAAGDADLHPLPFKVEASEVERLTVDTVTSIAAERATNNAAAVDASSSSSSSSSSAAGGASSSNKAAAVDPMISHWQSQLSSLAMLKERLGVIEAYLLAVKAGKIPIDRNILKIVSNTLTTLNTTEASAAAVAAAGGLSRDMAVETSDSLALSILSSVAKGAETAASLALKLSAADIRASSSSSAAVAAVTAFSHHDAAAGAAVKRRQASGATSSSSSSEDDDESGGARKTMMRMAVDEELKGTIAGGGGFGNKRIAVGERRKHRDWEGKEGPADEDSGGERKKDAGFGLDEADQHRRRGGGPAKR